MAIAERLKITAILTLDRRIAQHCIALQQEFLKHSLDYLKEGF